MSYLTVAAVVCFLSAISTSKSHTSKFTSCTYNSGTSDKRTLQYPPHKVLIGVGSRSTSLMKHKFVQPRPCQSMVSTQGNHLLKRPKSLVFSPREVISWRINIQGCLILIKKASHDHYMHSGCGFCPQGMDDLHSNCCATSWKPANRYSVDSIPDVLESTKKMSMSISFMLLVSLLQSFCLCLASGAFVDFQLTTEDPNHLTLECFSAVTGDVDYGSTIEFFSTPSEDAQPLGNIVVESNSANIFDVTPSNEAFLRCTSSDGSVRSDFVAIAGKTLYFK